MPRVSIVIPSYNEEKRLPSTLRRIKRYLHKKRAAHEVIVVDDGSKDNTAGAAKNFKGMRVRVVSNGRNMGKGFSVGNGIKNSKSPLILFTDADLSTPISHLDEFLAYHREGYDIVIGSRDLIDSKVVVPQNPLREFSGKLFNLLVRAVTGLPIHDTQCGFKSFTKKAAKEIFSRRTIAGFGFDVEVLYIARLRGFRIKEAPVSWYNAPGTKVSFFKDSLRMFLELFRIRLNGILGKYR